MPMELSKVPQILDILGVNKEEQKAILDFAKEKKIFAGEAAIQKGFATKEKLDDALGKQAILKAEAAAADLTKGGIIGKQEAPKWLKANWGNNGVNPPIKEPTVVDGASATANIAQNIAMLVNDKPEIVKDPKTDEDKKSAAAVTAAVAAASALTKGIAGKAKLDSEQAKIWMAQAKEGLELAVKKSGITPKDQKGKEINLDEYIKVRFTEIEAGVETRLKAQEAGKTAFSPNARISAGQDAEKIDAQPGSKISFTRNV